MGFNSHGTENNLNQQESFEWSTFLHHDPHLRTPFSRLIPDQQRFHEIIRFVGSRELKGFRVSSRGKCRVSLMQDSQRDNNR
ncbi:hypothetical protein CEXT_289551 [Caerostris extrusa]|uniref:Uncharacterized protein n=1 Tax=Caerostris extrusa TaxID=172846 RepID=A0AAV4WFF0_CAEEX|nr:hypothetical protein CEXT_289551 [Caerostris extrusa]